MLNINDCIINHALTGNSTNGHGIYCYFADILNVTNVKVYSAVWTDYSQCYPLYLAGTYQKGIECQIRNVEQVIRFNGSSATHLPTFIYLQWYISCEIDNIKVSF